MKSLCQLLGALGCALLLTAPALRAEEGGSGHYLPGSIASFVDGTPTAPAFVTRLNLIGYDASHPAPLPIAGLQPANVEANLFAAGLTMAWRPKWEPAPGWSYAMSATLAHINLEVAGNLTVLGQTVRRKTSVSGLGDIVLMPVMLSYTINPDLHLDFRTGIYAPTGSYQLGRLANTGKNFWTFEPTVGLAYFGLKNGREASLFMGMDFNGENDATHYDSGNQFRLDGTLAQHFPLAGGIAGVGLSAFNYDQVSADSGSGASFGAFKGHTFGYGPAVSFVTKAGSADLIVELKWLRETQTKNRLQGDYLWAKVVFKF
jgi:hypothetical protein